ncbi:copper transporter YcnJ [Kribbella jejuensis]|uniref:Putative copper export protein n=1 Tax=Kribbella jejuensis TaxID=236068 RepID=A0A542DT34_9ACTN|nr:copper resistance protein CopC [Kribbella jejuensis]TQJ06218.1 putative copper export protein [Kribbella jejuensis]
MRFLLLLFVAAIVWLSQGAVAQAHPVLLRSTPSDGQTVRTPPRQIDLWFSEPPTAAGLDIALSDRDGKAFPVTARIADQGIHVVLTGFPELPRSVYELRWSVVSKYDLHRLQGTLVFGVGLAATSSGRPAESVTGPAGTVADVVLGWFDLAATAVVSGWVLLVALWSRRRGFALPAESVVTMRGLAAAFAMLSVFASLARGARQWSEAAGADSGLAVVKDSGQLLRWSLREVVLVVICALLVRQSRRGASGSAATLPLICLLFGDLVLRAATSHARGGPLSLAVLAIHQVAALAWVGGLVVLGFLTARLRGERRLTLDLWRSFGPVAACSVAVLTITGLLLTGRQVASVDAALSTSYGRALLIKLTLAGVLMALGLRHALRLHPWLRRRVGPAVLPSSRAQAISPLLGVTVALMAVVLAVTPPARGPQFDKPEATASRADYQVDDLLITVSLGPNQPGRSLLLVDVVSSRRPSPGPITAVTADLGSTSGIVLRRTTSAAQTGGQGGGQWQAAVDVEATGPVPLRIVAARNHPGPAVVTTTWVVPTGLPRRPVVVSNSPLAPWTTGLAVAVALLASAVAYALLRRYRRTRRSVVTVEPVQRVPSGAG